ncbi:MAG: PQQ-binding-like beta-propeller repeat protein [Acidobacteria bacterium]|nr:PQQ-binding-like beta-propeller repeat protein [Acidobacteriota bacterium]
MRRIPTAAALLAAALLAGAGPGAGATAFAQPPSNPLAPAARPATAPPLPHASSNPSGAWVGDVLYMHAGEQPPAFRAAAGTGRAALYALSPGDASWTTVWTGDAVLGAELVSDGKDLYRVGGVEPGGDVRARPDLERWDGSERRWVDLTPMPSGRTDHAAVVVGRPPWVLGGWVPSARDEGPGARRRRPVVPAEDWREDVLVADLDRDPVAWTVVETEPLRLHSLAAALHGDAIWVVGGITPRGRELQVYRLDLGTRTLAPAPAPPVPGGSRSVGVGIAATGGNLYLSDSNQLFRLDADADTWETLAYAIEPDRAYHALVAGAGVLHIAGGAAHGRINAEVDRIEVASLRPSDVVDMRRAEGSVDAPPGAARRSSPAAPLGARRWPGFRGPAFGHSPARDLPLTWSDEENVAWRHAVGGYGQSSPVVWDGLVFVTAIDGPRRETQIIEAVDAETGALRWRHTLPSSQPTPVTPVVAKGAPTSWVDAERVYYLFESGDIGALNHDGEPVWSRALTADYGAIEGYGLGSSLAGNDEALFVLVAHDGPSYLLAVDPATGETRWKADRPARSAWTTPIVVPGGGGDLVVVSVDGAVEAYAAENGERVWWIDDVSGNRLSSPAVLAGGRLVVPSVDSRSTLVVPLEHRGPLAGDKVLWRGRGATAGMSSPVVTGGAVCLINSLGVIRCVEQRSGRSRWAARLPSPTWATSIVNGDRVYVFGIDGTATILAADMAEPIELARNSLTVPDRVYGVAAVDGALLVRTGRELIRIGRGGGAGE